jgi:hypothetical protein
MESCRIRHPHVDPRGNTAGHVSHECSRFVARRNTLGELDAFGVRQLSDGEFEAAGVGPGTIRLSVGTESVDDLIWDLEQGFARVSAAVTGGAAIV